MIGRSSRARLIVMLVIGVVIVLGEMLVLAAYAIAGDIGKDPLVRAVIPAALLVYGFYLVITSTRKLRTDGK